MRPSDPDVRMAEVHRLTERYVRDTIAELVLSVASLRAELEVVRAEAQADVARRDERIAELEARAAALGTKG
ncbi:MAG: hypothetical protein AB7Q16_24800 [Vicinamibacterales bacterium]